MRRTDVPVLRLQASAMAQGYGVACDVASRRIVLVPALGHVVSFRGIAAARSWLRVHLWCGSSARRCEHSGCRVCA